MKKWIVSSFLLLPMLGFSQVVDTAQVRLQADSLLKMSRGSIGKGRFEEATQLINEAEIVVDSVLGKKSNEYGNCLHLKGIVLFYQNKYLEAETCWLLAKEIREKTLGKGHPDYAKTLSNLANLYEVKKEYDKAERTHLEAIKIREGVYGKEHPEYVISLIGLASLYYSKGDNDKSESLYLEAKAISENIKRKEHPDYCTVLHNLSILYWAKGEYDKAEPLCVEAKTIREKVLGKNHPDYAKSVQSLAILYKDQGKYNMAESLYLEANSILEKTLGKDNPDYAASLGNLTTFYLIHGNYDKAEYFCQASKDIFEKALGKSHPEYAKSIQQQAIICKYKYNYEKAEPLLLEVKSIQEKALGKQHPDYASNLYELAALYYAKGEISRVGGYLLENNLINKSLLQIASTYYTEPEMLKYVERPVFRRLKNALFSFIQAYPVDSLCAAAYDNVLFLNNALLDATIAREKGIRISTDDSLRTIYSDFRNSRFQLNKWYSRPISKRDSNIIARLEEHVRLNEKELIRRSPEFVESQRVVHWREVQEKLKPNEAAIEFVHYRYYLTKATDSTMYAALLLRPGDIAPQFIPLFEEREIAPRITQASGTAVENINALYFGPSAEQTQKSLYELIFKPLEAQLQGVHTVYCAPSGLLHRLNLDAVLNSSSEGNKKTQRVVTLGSTRRLVLPDNSPRTGFDAYLAGGLRYDSDSTAIAMANARASGTRGANNVSAPLFQSDSTVHGQWEYLPYSASEVREIGHNLQSAGWSVTLDMDYNGTEDFFRETGQKKPSPRIIHLSTHGFFYPDPQKKEDKFPWFTESQDPVFKLSEHPMIRSGLILAGANAAWAGQKVPEDREDGILTAYEISQMNLSNTELVVLSACETGLGDIQGNEGVYGLQRAFKIAGAKYLIMSLWQVSDLRTQELMDDFYKQWQVQGMSIPEAFRTAQDNMKKRFPEEPYYWAGFILVE